jgi:DNA (cytosine-5)-methyltransferase 1
LPRPSVDFWRGDAVAFPGARVYSPRDSGLVAALRAASKASRGHLTAIDLFSGAGGLSLGLEGAGIHLLLAADSDAASCETHANAFGGVTVHTDLRRPAALLAAFREAGIDHVDIVAGGPPCQPFSRAARSKIRSLEETGSRGPDQRPTLWFAFMRFVDALSPNFVLIENVPDMVLWEEGQTVRRMCGALEERGFEVQARVLRCWEFGVPQHRQRLIVVASPPASFQWPRRQRSAPILRDAIGDLPAIGAAQRRYWMPLKKAPATPFQRRMRRGSNGRVSDHITRDVREDDLEAFALLKAGRRYPDLPKRLRRYRADIFDDKYNVLKWNELSRSITAHMAKDGYWYIHPNAKRMLSIREAARLQTFPDRFRFAGHPSDRLRQIGNAVPPEVARRLANRIVAGMERKTVSSSFPFRASEFRRNLAAWHRHACRQFPWRQVDDPWLLLVAEILLRRTRAQAVAEVWSDLAKHFPRPVDVLREPNRLRELLYPLGLRWRVENVIEVAKALENRHRGVVPSTRKDLMSLPGVGDYVADAVLAFAFDNRAVLVDSNTARIATRVFGLEEEWTSLRNLDLRASVARLGGVHGPTPALNLALLDLGGTVCLARKPKCPRCPVRRLCYTGQREVEKVG